MLQAENILVKNRPDSLFLIKVAVEDWALRAESASEVQVGSKGNNAKKMFSINIFTCFSPCGVKHG